MNEEEFEALIQPRPFGTGDAIRMDAQWRRMASLAVALWGRTSSDLMRQLEAKHPQIPPGFDRADYRRLQQHAHRIAEALDDGRFAWASRSSLFSTEIVVGSKRMTAWEARCEIIRRAIEYLEDSPTTCTLFFRHHPSSSAATIVP